MWQRAGKIKARYSLSRKQRIYHKYTQLFTRSRCKCDSLLNKLTQVIQGTNNKEFIRHTHKRSPLVEDEMLVQATTLCCIRKAQRSRRSNRCITSGLVAFITRNGKVSLVAFSAAHYWAAGFRGRHFVGDLG